MFVIENTSFCKSKRVFVWCKTFVRNRGGNCIISNFQWGKALAGLMKSFKSKSTSALFKIVFGAIQYWEHCLKYFTAYLIDTIEYERRASRENTSRTHDSIAKACSKSFMHKSESILHRMLLCIYYFNSYVRFPVTVTFSFILKYLLPSVCIFVYIYLHIRSSWLY